MMFARSILVGLLVATCVPAPAAALSIFNGVPAVSGHVLGPDGAALANAKVSVHFLGTNDRLLDSEKQNYEIKVLEAVTGPDGSFSLDATSINLVALKAKFVGAELRVSAKGCEALAVQVINQRAFGGAIGVFLIGLVDAQGDDFNGPPLQAIPHAYDCVKESKFSRVYEQLFAEPIHLGKVGAEAQQQIHFVRMYRGQ